MFSKGDCGVCKNPIGSRFTSLKLNSGDLICENCASHIDTGIDMKKFKELSTEDARSYIKYRLENLDFLKKFNIDKKVETPYAKLAIDLGQKKFYIEENNFFQVNKNPQLYNFRDILSYNIVKDDETVYEDGLSKAIFGGILAGWVGALVGASMSSQEDYIKNLGISISIDSPYKSNLFISIIENKINKSSQTYKEKIDMLNSTISVLDYMLKQGCEESIREKISSSFVADEIFKLKSLMNQGLITKEQFIRKRDELMEE